MKGITRRNVGQFFTRLFGKKEKVNTPEKAVFNKPDTLEQEQLIVGLRKKRKHGRFGGSHDRCYMHQSCYCAWECLLKGINVDPCKKACSKAK
jgi:hypothetical protein